MKVIKTCRGINTTIAAIDSDMPSLVSLKKSIGENSVQAYIEMWIINLLEFINIGKSMSDTQVFETASMIICEFSLLNLSDINLIFKMGKMGKFGQIYDRLDGQIILGWFEKYFQMRCSDAAERSINNSLKNKENNTPPFSQLAKKYNMNN